MKKKYPQELMLTTSNQMLSALKALEHDVSIIFNLEVPFSDWPPVPLIPSKTAEPLYDLPAGLPTAAADYNFLQ
jgi:hypothetical protein